MGIIAEQMCNVKLEIGDQVFARTSRGWWPGQVCEFSGYLDKFHIALEKLYTKSGHTKHWPKEAKYCSPKPWLRGMWIKPNSYVVKLRSEQGGNNVQSVN